MTKDELNKIFQEAHQELVLELTSEKNNRFIVSAILLISNVISGWAFISFKSSAISFGVVSIIIFIKSTPYFVIDSYHFGEMIHSNS